MSRVGHIVSVYARRQQGAALVEYLVVALLLVLALIANPNVFVELADALRNAYASFVYALSTSWI
ncbi:MAG: hypothetical protein CVV16_07360 [Gammaproteobacteria bacterium HGW-Gammaproteobacteria-6]|jgi:Flp pilus assembly pilin Flp|nr:MAG: hypothetical protein CVV16_07360 [Gammaproteobacteria bacterium HGW-Gammaproteobacteria-6]PKM16669.1 MAG: hypothetical protein CVV12_01875 [Gammaproteobacteria bacterium HGW-Gammaproteobacteria-2]